MSHFEVRLVIAFALTAHCSPVLAENLTLRLAPAAPAEVKVRLLPRSDQGDVVTQILSAGTTQASFELSDGLWAVQVESPGHWAPEKLAVLKKDSRQEVLVPIFPLVIVTGKVETRQEGAAGTNLRLRLTTATNASPSASHFETDCPVVDSGFRCEAPAGSWDLRFRLPSHASQYLWDVPLQPGSNHEIGTLSFQPGSSVVGWAPGCATESHSRCVASLTPWLGDNDSPQQAARAETLRHEIEVGPRGFFNLQGLGEGTYLLEVQSIDDKATRRIFPIPVHEGMETEIAAPIVLEPLLRLELEFQPTRDIKGRPWHLTLQEVGISGTSARLIADGTVTNGRWNHEALPPGSYRLVLSDRDGSRWLSQDIEISAAQRQYLFQLPVIHVEGTVWLGDEPIEAELWFGGQYGAQRIRAQSNAEGEFETVLPKEGSWPVTVLSKEHNVQRTLRTEVSAHGGSVPDNVELRLPRTEISGVVTDSSNRHFENAFVTLSDLSSQERPVVLRSDESGRFMARGLGPGELRVFARGGGLQSEELRVAISGDMPPPEVTLVLREMRVVEGLVRSNSGPVPGAQVVTVATDTFWGEVTVTESDGTFTSRVPSSSPLNFMVLPPGRTFTVAKLLAGQEQVVVHLEDVGGELILNAGFEALRFNSRGETIVFFAGDVAVDVGTLQQWSRTQRSLGAIVQDDRGIILPQMAPGEYSLCRLSASAMLNSIGRANALCVKEILAPGDSRSLDAARLQRSDSTRDQE